MVFKGNLSLVGPRPHAVHAKAENRLYDEAVDGYFARHRVKPGITGWAQISGWRGETDTQEKIQRRVEHDLYYIENWSVLFDLFILAKTPLALGADRECVLTGARVSRAQCSMSSAGSLTVHACASPGLLMMRCRPGTAQNSGAHAGRASGGPGSATHRSEDKFYAVCASLTASHASSVADASAFFALALRRIRDTHP